MAYVRLARPLSNMLFLAGALLAVPACGGGDSGGSVTLVDAAEPIDAAVDAAPVCSAPNMMCGADCLDVSTDEQHCGNCSTTCTANVCLSGVCSCPATFLPANPRFAQAMVSDQLFDGATVGFGLMGTGVTLDVFAAGYATDDVMLNHAYPLSSSSLGNPPTPPFAAIGYDLDLQGFTLSAGYYATEGTITFTKVCDGGMAGTLANVKFSMVSDLFTNPTLVPGGCTVPATGTIATVSFAIGTACP
jgi:hypothetical protein